MKVVAVGAAEIISMMNAAGRKGLDALADRGDQVYVSQEIYDSVINSAVDYSAFSDSQKIFHDWISELNITGKRIAANEINDNDRDKYSF